MSRSYLRTPITGRTAAPSEKREKREASQRLRQRVHEQLSEALKYSDPEGIDEAVEVLPDTRELTNSRVRKDEKRWIRPEYRTRKLLGK